MKKLLLVSACSALLFTVGCSLMGIDTNAPNAVERKLYTTLTNWVEVPIAVVVTNQQTNVVVQFATNTIGNIITVTNEQVIAKYETHTITNLIPQYENRVSDNTQATIKTGGGILNTFFPGVGSIASSGLLAILAAWGHFRSGKRGQTSTALAQEIETMREFVKSLPNGAQYDNVLTTFLQTHQMQSGVAQSVLNILGNSVSNNDAKAVVTELQQTLEALTSSAKK